ncbi:MAG TPA: NAD(P)/FAD-dependent oxidoreductase [Mycobacteriales bacterium]|nr:NAD(P)/FAD-dependent oxidoreductase [Mycobacteriales bacterium]
MPSPRTEVDAVVVGGGAAGLAAALWLGRYRRSVLLVDSQEYRSAQVEISHGYLGRDPQAPGDLLATGREELLRYPTAKIHVGRVDNVVRREDDLFAVDLGSEEVLAHRVVLACGVSDVFPDVGGFREHYGASLFHCPACDGYEARDGDVIALGWSDAVAGFAATLKNWARSVTVVTDGKRFEGEAGARDSLRAHEIEVIEEGAQELVGSRGDLTGLRLVSGRLLPATLCFFSIAHVPRNDLARALGCDIDDEGYVTVDNCGRTSTPGVYAAGDLTPGLQFVQVAAASGTVAGVTAAQSFFGERGAPTSPDPAPDVT